MQDNQLLSKEMEQLTVTEHSQYQECEQRNNEMNRILTDPDLDHFKTRVNQIFEDLKNHCDSERQIFRKCRNVKLDIESVQSKINDCQKHIEEKRQLSQAIIRDLERKEAEAEELRKEEAHKREEILKLKDEKLKIQKEAEKSRQALESKYEGEIDALIKKEEEANKQKEEALSKAQSLISLEQQANKSLIALEKQLLQINDDTQRLEESIQRDKQRKELMDKEKATKQNTMKVLSQKIKEFNELGLRQKAEIEEIIRVCTALYEQIGKTKQNKDKKNRELGTKSQQRAKDLKEKQNKQENLQILIAEVNEREKKMLELEAAQLEAQKELQKTQEELINAGKFKLEKQKELDVVTKQKDMQSSQKEQIEEELEKCKKTRLEKRKELDEEKRRRAKEASKLKTTQTVETKVNHEMMEEESNRKKYNNELEAYKAENEKLKKKTDQLEREQEKYGIEASQAHAKYYQTVEEVKIKNTHIQRLKRTNEEYESKLKHQQNLYEAVRSDRNLYAKDLNKSKEESAELLRKFTRMTHEVEQLREEIKLKDQRLVAADGDLKAIEKENVENKNQRTRNENLIRLTEELLGKQEATILDLKKVIQEAKAQRTKQQKDYDMVVNERDILCTLLIKRTQELQVLYQKIKLSGSNLAKGQLHYNEMCKEYDKLKRTLATSINELSATQAQVACIEDLKAEITRKEKDLLNQRAKIQALQNELTKPMNVHRWRQLEATDQDNFERILKIQTLQRRLIAKTEEVQQKENLIREKEKLFLELKNILARQHGVEVHQQLSANKQALKEKKAQMKKLLEELTQASSEVQLLRAQITRLKGEMTRMRQEYFKMRQDADRAQNAGYETHPLVNYDTRSQNLEIGGHA